MFILYFIDNMVSVNYTYDMIINTQVSPKIVRACSVFYPYEGYRSVGKSDVATATLQKRGNCPSKIQILGLGNDLKR